MSNCEFCRTKLFTVFAVLIIAFSGAAQEINQPSKDSTLPSKSLDAGEAPTANENGYKLRRGTKEFNVEFGYSPFQPTFFAEKEYDTKNRSLALATFRFGRVIGTKGPVTYQYLFEANPLVIAFKNEVENRAYRSPQETPGVAPTIRKTVYGAGIEPAVFRFIFRPSKRFKPYAQVGAGFIVFNRALPIPAATGFNFTGDFGGGVQFYLSPKQAISLGYRYFHISNFDITKTNPGYNANVFYLGYSFFK